MGRRAICVSIVVAAVSLLALPASAKGISYAHFTGPGLPPGGVTLHGEDQQLWQIGLTEPKMESSRLSRAELGSAYRASYRLDYAPHAILHQVLYPYAHGGPVTFTPPGQHIGQDSSSFPGGWYFALSDLSTFLSAHGFPRHDPTVQTGRVVVVHPAVNDEPAGSSVGWPWVVLGLGALLGFGSALVVRRRSRAGA